MPLTANKILKVSVSEDKLTAKLTLNKGATASSLTSEQIESEVGGLGIRINDQGRANIAEFATQCAAGQVPQPIVVAQGERPTDDRNGYLKKLYEFLAILLFQCI